MSPKLVIKKSTDMQCCSKAGVEENYTVEYDETCTSNGFTRLVKELQMQSVKQDFRIVDVKTVEKLIKGQRFSNRNRNITFKNFVNNN